MKESVDFRLPEDWAQSYLDEGWGHPVKLPHGYAPMIRQVVTETSDPRFKSLKELLAKFPPDWITVIDTREYLAFELSEAPVLHLVITKFTDACGEDYGTVYDESQACPRCGLGRKQLSPLRMDLAKMPKRGGFAATIARGEELLVSESVAQIVRNHGIAGCRLDPVEHVGRSDGPKWHQLVITGKAGETVPPTRFAVDFLRNDTPQEFVCPEHGLSGLNLVSEVYVQGTSVEAADVLKTTNRYGRRDGALMPSPVLLISQKFYQLLKDHGIRGFKAEVAHLT